MSFEAYIGLAGAAIGSAISLLTVYLTQNLTEKREARKNQALLEKEAISQIYSPLVFILHKIGEIFVSIISMKETLDQMSDDEKKKNAVEVSIIQYLLAKKAATHPKLLEKLLSNKADLIESPYFYTDLLALQSYLSTIVGFLDSLIIVSGENIEKLKRCMVSFGPIMVALDEVAGKMRIYSMQKATRHRVEYKLYFDEKKILEVESYVGDINKVITGLEVPDWGQLIESLRNEERKESDKA
jgi:hypothetical protein